jgi:hypothetical protein
LKPEEYL